MKKQIVLLLVITLMVTAGCSVNIYKKSRPSDRAKIEELTGEVDRLNKLRAQEIRQFDDIKRDLQKGLKGKVGLEVEERGLVITLADNILFDSGKAKIKEDAYPVLDKIIAVVDKRAPNKNIGVEGHTDNVPIKYSGWKSNRELSTTRANNVYHYLVENGIDPSRLTTMGYGEYHPVGSNDTADGRAKNRRVEIVILPQYPKRPVEEIESFEESEEETWVK
ncbi:flagellar motor protein MotB [Candidatus Omnitrophota bacterium]